MATSTKNKKNPPPPPPPKPPKPEEVALAAIERKRQIRLGIGIFLLLAGVFTCFSIISYYFSWTADQDKFLNSTSMWGFVFDRDSDPVANWGGRFGAALSHILVFNGAGVASMVIGLAIGGIGLHVVYGNKMLPVLRYLRWVSILLLLVAPILTYLFPLSSFPLGGRLGTGAISYLNGFLGSMGTGMVLL
jgi:DNA segregation ATPase FtsK/SpoIIIE, S-DNA-T family